MWLATADGLELAASVGVPTGGGSYSRLDGSFSRIPLGDGKIGGIAASRTPLVVPSLRGDEEWLSNPGWIARQGVRAFVGHPLTVQDDLLGVLAIFVRSRPSRETLAAWDFLARYTATRLAQIRDRDALLARIHALESRAHSQLHQTPVTPIPAVPRRPIMTRGELRVLERDALEAALAQSSGRLFGPNGAATLLGMKPTTLASRMKALGLPSARVIRRGLKSPS